MRIIGHTVTRNELGRYLPANIRWLQEVTDAQLLYDDRSTDGTYEHIQDAGLPVEQRPADQPSFHDDESAFRAAAWQAMERHHTPGPRDWILCVDADEFVTAPDPEQTRQVLANTVRQHTGTGGIVLTVKEVFGLDDDGTPLLRTDGLWGTIHGCRLVRWRPNGHFPSCREGGGSVPRDWMAGAVMTENVTIMHLGYVRPADRTSKHAHYSATRGHDPQHIASIIEPPTLVRWEGMRMIDLRPTAT